MLVLSQIMAYPCYARRVFNISLTDIILVIDTNVMLDHLSQLDHLFDYNLVLVFPWAVIQELDGMKSSSKGDKRRKVTEAIDWIHNKLYGNGAGLKDHKIQGKIIFQQSQEDQDWSERFNLKTTKDDHILSVALHFHHLGHRVILITRDKNLQNKSMIHGVEGRELQFILDQTTKS